MQTVAAGTAGLELAPARGEERLAAGEETAEMEKGGRSGQAASANLKHVPICVSFSIHLPFFAQFIFSFAQLSILFTYFEC